MAPRQIRTVAAVPSAHTIVALPMWATLVPLIFICELSFNFIQIDTVILLADDNNSKPGEMNEAESKWRLLFDATLIYHISGLTRVRCATVCVCVCTWKC